jgi:hypothetical protein
MLPKPLTPNQFQDTMMVLNQLRNFHISGNVADIQFMSSSPGVKLPSLHSLTVSPFPQTDLYGLIVHLKCPVLEHLTIGSAWTDGILPELTSAL